MKAVPQFKPMIGQKYWRLLGILEGRRVKHEAAGKARRARIRWAQTMGNDHNHVYFEFPWNFPAYRLRPCNLLGRSGDRCHRSLYLISTLRSKKLRLTEAMKLDYVMRSTRETASGLKYKSFPPDQALSQESSTLNLKEDAESGEDGEGRGGPKLSPARLFLLVKYKLAKYRLLITNTLHFGNTSQLTEFSQA